jgi:hypothetical protein
MAGPRGIVAWKLSGSVEIGRPEPPRSTPHHQHPAPCGAGSACSAVGRPAARHMSATPVLGLVEGFMPSA